MTETTSNPKTLSTMVHQLQEHGERPAVIRFLREGQEAWSYARLARETKAFARGLIETGVQPGEKIAVIAEPSPEWFVAGLGILAAGAVLVPLDTQMSDKDLRRVFGDSGVRRIFSTARIARRIEELKVRRRMDIFLLDEDPGEDEGKGHQNWRSLLRSKRGRAAGSAGKSRSPAEDDPAVLFYTSGTTGPPKGVPLSHRNIVFQIRAVEKTGLVKPNDRLLLPLPLHHVYPLVIGVLTPLALGVAIVLPHALTGDGIVRALSEGKGSVILGVPRLYRALFEGIRAKAGAAGSIAATLFRAGLGLARKSGRIGLPLGKFFFRPVRRKMGPRVRLLASGGSPLDPELAENLEALGWPIAVGYGLTETSPLLTIKRPGEGDHATVGRPIEGVELRIDPSGFPEGEGKAGHKRGEVLARGPSVFSGYHKRPDKTEEAFSDGWFRTGDLGYLDDKGYLFLGGRASSMIVLEGGENINPENLEDAYAECDEVAEIGILEDNGKLAALVVPSREVLRKREPAEIRRVVTEALRRRASGMPSYKRLSNIEITRQPLPTTRLGKIKRHVLEKRYAAAKEGEEKRTPGPVPIEELSSEERILLEDPRARKLWELFAKRYPDRRLTPEANLEVDLGIDSLEWVELSLSAHQRAGLSIDEDVIGRVETVRDLLEAAAGAGAEEVAEGRRPIEHPEEVLSESDKRWATRRGPVLAGVATIAYGMLRSLVKGRCRIEARGLENLPEKGPFLLVPNHVSYLDAPALSIALGFGRAKHCFWAGRGEILFRNAWRRGISRLFQVVPIDPKRGPLSSLAVGALVLKRGHPLVWFPEGGISLDGKLQRFQPGIGLIIAHYEPPVIPVFLEGTREVLPLGSKFLRSGRITVHFGQMIDGRKLKAKAKRGEAGQVHERITRELRESVEGLGEAVTTKNEPHRKAA